MIRISVVAIPGDFQLQLSRSIVERVTALRQPHPAEPPAVAEVHVVGGVVVPSRVPELLLCRVEHVESHLSLARDGPIRRPRSGNLPPDTALEAHDLQALQAARVGGAVVARVRVW